MGHSSKKKIRVWELDPGRIQVANLHHLQMVEGDHDHGVLGGLAIMISIYISDSGQMYVNL